MEYMPKKKAGTHPAAGAHGAGLRGEQVNRGSRTFVGRFGRMFRTLPAAEFDKDALKTLAEAMSADAERANEKPEHPKAAREIDNPSEEEKQEGFDGKFHDGEENTGILAGYTYLGQFIDHDITFDPASSLQKQNDPDGLINFRTPALDLDCIYGRGPDDQPYMFEPDGKTFRLGKQLTQGGKPSTSRDLPRLKWAGELQTNGTPFGISPARALIGDKRNDENVIVSQLHGTFLQFHNRLSAKHQNLSFKELQRKVRWHYQYVVLNDFLPTIVGEDTMHKVWPGWRKGNVCGNEPNLCLYHVKDKAYMPIEFSVAAYRFGHSMVRPIYRLNTVHNGGQDPLKATPDEIEYGLAGRFFIFAGVQKRGLNGLDEFPSDWAIDWRLFFDIDGSIEKTGKLRVQPGYKIDTSLVNPLAFLPEFSEPPMERPAGEFMTVEDLQSDEKKVKPESPSNLAIRNLLRGNSMGLPSGQDVARAMGVAPLTGSELAIGKAQFDEGKEEIIFLNDFEVVIDGEKVTGYFADSTPLWFYVLAEAQSDWRRRSKDLPPAEANKLPVTLGPVGGRIVAETLIGLLISDSHSYLNQDPNWIPEVGGAWVPVANAAEGKVLESMSDDDGRCNRSTHWKKFTMGDFIRYALDIQ